MNQSMSRRLQARRPVDGVAACLLPFEQDGSIALTAFQEGVERTQRAGLRCAVNMDTGYGGLLSRQEREAVLRATNEVLGEHSTFVAGVYAGTDEDICVENCRREMELVSKLGAVPIVVQTALLQCWEDDQIVMFYQQLCEGFEEVLAFELNPIFSSNGMMFSEDVVAQLMAIPALKGMKHSSLSREEEFCRLRIRDRERPDFKIYTGNDLAVDMIEYGSDYLLGLAAFCPEKFAERDRYFTEGKVEYLELNDAIQHLGNVAFRPSIPAYKHSCAIFQHLLGRIPSNLTHPLSLTRATWEIEVMQECAERLGYAVDSLTV